MDKYPGFTKQQKEQIHEEGYILIEDALEPFGLDNVIRAWERIQAEEEPGWKQAVAGTGTRTTIIARKCHL